MSGASRAPSTQPSHASTARARLTSSRWAAGLGVLPGWPAQPLNPPYIPFWHLPHTQWLPKSLWFFWDSKQPQPHDEAPQHPLAPPGRPVAGGCCTVTPLCPPLPRAPSTGALMTESWTLGTPGTSLRALRAYLTMWMQLSPSLPTATTAMRESTSSRVRETAPLLLAEPGTTGHRLDTPPVLVPN